MNERCGMNWARRTTFAAMLVLGGTNLGLAQSRHYDDAPDYQRAPTQSGNWRYDGPDEADRGRDEPQRYETINRARTGSRSSSRTPSDSDRVEYVERRAGDYQRDARYYTAPPAPPRSANNRDTRASNKYAGPADSEGRIARPGAPAPAREPREVRRPHSQPLAYGGERAAYHEDVHSDHDGHGLAADSLHEEYTAQRSQRRRDERVQPTGYQWRASREQAQRSQLSEAPAYEPGSTRAPGSVVLPKRDLLEDRGPRIAGRPTYRPAAMNREYDLPPAQPEAEHLPSPSRGNVTYQDRGGASMQGGMPGDYVVDGDSDMYPSEYGYGDDGFMDDGYGPYEGGPYTYDEFGRPLYLTPCEYCGQCCGGISCHHRWLDESSVFAGVHAFKGGLDQGQNGNFGFQEAVNFAGALWHEYGIGYQVGAQFVQSNLSGSNIANAFNNSRQQDFLTAGLYHRPNCGQGFQGGAVFDWLNDRFYTTTRFAQVRGELSYIFPRGNEFGFWGAFATGNDQTLVINGKSLTFSPANMYNFFYRKTFENGDQGRIWGGFTNGSAGILGADYRVHMSNRWDVIGGFNYLIPDQGKDNGGAVQESWGLAMNVVWYPTRPACGTHNGPFRSLFGVADNNVFMVRQK